MSAAQGYTVTVEHDAEERVWYVVSSNVPGLNAEAKSLDELVAVILDAAPGLLAANGDAGEAQASVPLVIQHTVSLTRAA